MLNEKLELVPMEPGCYLMKNKDGIIIYVGKAKILKNRLNSYFKASHTGKTKKLVSEIADFEYIVVGSEKESLILEINLIKKYDPKYNILLRDDKSYPYIAITNDTYFKVSIVRSIDKYKRRDHLFGPYPNVTAVRNIVNMLNRVYPLRKCNTYNKKPCLYYHINECLGYCTKKIDKEKMDAMKKEIVSFLHGDDSIVRGKLIEEIEYESGLMHYEKALELKNMLDYIDITLAKQKVEINDNHMIDVFGFYELNGYIGVQVLFIRGGKIIGRHACNLPMIQEFREEANKYVANFYSKNMIKPKYIFVPDFIDCDLASDYLGVSVSVPLKGVKHKLVLMACDNARISLNENFELIKRDEEKTVIANNELMNILGLDKLDRIEIFDNSNLFGTYNVSGMVVFKNGKPSKNDYRKFKISIDKNDDYGTMREVIYRRYFRVLMDELERPDLVIVDGGIGQINVAREVIRELGLDICVIGLKKNDKHVTDSLIAFDSMEVIPIDKHSNLFHYLMNMQEEVHNFTINYHKQIRSKGSLESVLDNIQGIGSKRRDELLKKYKTINKLKSLSVSELSSILPSDVAKNLKEFLDNY